MTISTHVLDTARGVPGAGISVALYLHERDLRRFIARADTNIDGRTAPALATDIPAGAYELYFDVAPYFERTGTPAFYDEICVRIVIIDATRSYHVPLLLAPWGYSTYRGS